MGSKKLQEVLIVSAVPSLGSLAYRPRTRDQSKICSYVRDVKPADGMPRQGPDGILVEMFLPSTNIQHVSARVNVTRRSLLRWGFRLATSEDILSKQTHRALRQIQIPIG